jgi:hypothetical protein
MHFKIFRLFTLYIYLDGLSSGKIGDDIRKLIKIAPRKKPKIINYEPIQAVGFPILSEGMINDLSTDQKNLYKRCLALQTGVCDDSLALTRTGNLTSARWLTKGE